MNNPVFDYEPDIRLTNPLPNLGLVPNLL